LVLFGRRAVLGPAFSAADAPTVGESIALDGGGRICGSTVAQLEDLCLVYVVPRGLGEAAAGLALLAF